MNKKIFAVITAGALAIGGPVLAGLNYQPDPPVVVEQDDDSDATAALILLAMIGGIIATSQIVGRSKPQIMEPGAPVDE